MSGAGSNVGLSALVQIEPDDYVAYSQSFYGAYILIHGPRDFPQASVTSAIGQPGNDVAISVTPSVTVGQPYIRGLPLNKRNCLFSDEVNRLYICKMKFTRLFFHFPILSIYRESYELHPGTPFKRVLQSVQWIRYCKSAAVCRFSIRK